MTLQIVRDCLIDRKAPGQPRRLDDRHRSAEANLSPICATADTTLVLFLVDRTVTGSKAGTISGR